jgi:hypothetical protein
MRLDVTDTETLFLNGERGVDLRRSMYQCHVVQHLSEEPRNLFSDIPNHQGAFSCTYQVRKNCFVNPY